MNKDLISRLVQRAKALGEPEDRGLFINAVYIWGANILPGLIGALFWWLASRFYSPAEIGLASAVISAAILLAMLSRLGLDISLIRFLPDTEEEERLINSVLSFILLTSILATGLFLLLVPIISPKLIELTRTPLFIGGFGLLVILSMVISTLRAVYVGKRAAKYTLLTSLMANGIKTILVAFGGTLRVVGIVSSVLVGAAVSVIVGFKLYLPKLIQGFKIKPGLSWSLLAPIIPYSLGNFLADLVMLAPQTVLPLMILNTLGEESNGHAYVALMLGSMLAGLGLALERSAFAEGANRIDRSGAIIRSASFVGGIITLPLAIITMILAPILLRIFGASYSLEATGLLRWVALSSPMTVLIQLFFTKLRIEKEIRTLVWFSILNVSITLVASQFSLPRAGVSGAGIGVLSGNLVTLSLILIFYRNQLFNSDLS